MARTIEGMSRNFLFRDLDSNILIGMASDRYVGWFGQIQCPSAVLASGGDIKASVFTEV
jgi:hypothetical protein